MMCDCIEKFNVHLAPHNTRIKLPFWSSSGHIAPFVETDKIDSAKRGKPKSVAASYCPFCGEEYATATRPPQVEDSRCPGGVKLGFDECEKCGASMDDECRDPARLPQSPQEGATPHD